MHGYALEGEDMNLLIVILVLVFFLALVLLGLDHRNRKLRGEISVLEQIIDAKDESFALYMDTYKISQEALQEDEKRNKKLKKKDEEIATFKNEIALLHNDCMSKENQIFDLEQGHKKIIDDVTEKIFLLEKQTAKQNDMLVMMQQEYKLEIETQEKEKKRLKEVLTSNEKDIQKLKLDKMMIEKSFTNLDSMHKLDLENERQSHESVVANMSEIIFNLEKSILQHDEEKVVLYEEHNVVNKALNTIEKKYKDITQRHTQYVQESKQQLKSLEEKMLKLDVEYTSKIQQLHSALEVKEERLEKSNQVYSDVKKKYSDTVQAFELKIKDLLHEIDIKDEQNVNLQEELKQMGDTTNNAMQKLNETLKYSQEKCTQLEKQYQEQIKVKQDQISQLLTRIEKFSADHESTYIKQSNKIDALTMKLKEQNAKLALFDTMKAKYFKLSSQEKKEKKNSVDRLEKDIMELREELRFKNKILEKVHLKKDILKKHALHTDVIALANKGVKKKKISKKLNLPLAYVACVIAANKSLNK